MSAEEILSEIRALELVKDLIKSNTAKLADLNTRKDQTTAQIADLNSGLTALTADLTATNAAIAALTEEIELTTEVFADAGIISNT